MPKFRHIELEYKLLSGLIKTESNVNSSSNLSKTLSAGLNIDSFSSDFRGKMFGSIQKYFEKYSSSPTYDACVTIIKNEYTEPAARDEKISLLDAVMEHSLDPDEVQSVIDEIKKLHNLRRIETTVCGIVDKLTAMKDGSSMRDDKSLIAELTTTLDRINASKLEDRLVEEDAFKDVRADLDELRDLRDHPEKYKGVSTGIEILDKLTCGWQPGDLITVLGRTGAGKSILLLNFAASAWMAGYNVMYVTIEMPIKQQKRRLFSKLTGASYFKFKDPASFSDEEMEAVEEKLREIKSQRDNELLVVDISGCNANYIEKRIQNWERTRGKKLDLLVIDPIYLMTANEKNDDNLGAVSWDLKLLARKYGVPCVVANQINREGHKRHQTGKSIDAMDSASSDKLGQNSDIMLGIYSDGSLFVKLSVVKYRDGGGCDMYFRRNFDHMSFDFDPDYGENSQALELVSGSSSSASSGPKSEPESGDGLG